VSDTTNAAEQLGIIELGEVCNTMRARNIKLFEQLGGWVADTTDPALQRLFAEACHRHAWHAELWAHRAPDIRPVEVDTSATAAPGPLVAAGERGSTYRGALDRLLADLHELLARVDVLLDPGTARTIALVTVDLADLQRRLTASIS
jgi:hypothetical protein